MYSSSSFSPVRANRQTASKEGSISKHSPVNNGNVGAVAAKINRVKQNRSQVCQQASALPVEKKSKTKSKQQRDLSPLSKLALNYLSSSTQEISNDIISGKEKKSNLGLILQNIFFFILN